MFRLIARAMMHSMLLATLCSVILLGHSRTGYALPTLNTCGNARDGSSYNTLTQDSSVLIQIRDDGTCPITPSAFVDSRTYAGGSYPIAIINNMHNDGLPAWYNNVDFQFDSSITEITINGTTASARNEFQVTSDTTFTIEYKYTDDKYYRFVTTATPSNFTMSGFTIEEFIPSTGPTSSETKKVVSTFLNNRANHVLSHQPNISGFLDGSNLNGGGPLGNLGLDANADGVNLGFSTSRSRVLAAQSQAEGQNQNTASSDDNIQLALASGNEEAVQTGYAYSNADESRIGTYDVWTELYGSTTNADTSDSSYWVGYVGGHYFINEQTLVGLMGQYDWSKESDASVSSNANGRGWMIGPYLAGQLPDQKLFYEARASWGQSYNKVSPDGTYTDAFDTTRWLVNAKISGAYAIDHLILKPAISVSYYEETQKSYTDTNANVIAAQTISIGELKFGPTLTDNIKLDNGLLFQPSFGINGVYNFAIKDNVASQGAALGNNDLRARVDAGFNLVDQDKGRAISASGFYDGIGINNYQSYGGKVRLTISFN